MLAREQRRRNEHHRLLAVLHRLERGAHRDLGLAVADVAAHEPVHRDRPLHVRLDLLDRAQLVGRLFEGERLLHLALPRCVDGERVAGRGQALAVEHDELFSDLLHRAAHARALALEVGAAHPVERRRLAAGVLPDEPHLVGGYVHAAVAELEPQVVALDTAHRERLHLEVPADPVHVVHHVVAGLQCVVVVGAASRAARPAVHPAAAGEVGLGDECQSRARQHHAAFQGRDRDTGVEALGRKHVAQPLRRTGTLRGEHHAVTLAFERAQPSCEGVGVAHDGIERSGRDARGVGPVRRAEHRHRTRRGVREQAVERERQARELGIAGGVPRDRERRRERRLVVEQLLRAVAHALRFDEQRDRAARQQIGEEVVALGEPREPRLHAVEHLAVGKALPLLAAPGMRAQELRGAFTYLVGREQLSRGEDLRRGDVVGRALVGHRERRQPVDLVAPQIDSHRVVVGGRVHVDDRAPHRDLAARFHLVLAPVPARDEARHQLVAVELRAGPHLDRLDVLDVRTEPLHERAHRRDHDRGRVVGVLEAPQHAEPAAHRLE